MGTDHSYCHPSPLRPHLSWETLAPRILPLSEAACSHSFGRQGAASVAASVASRQGHIPPLSSGTPHLMVRGIEQHLARLPSHRRPVYFQLHFILKATQKYVKLQL